MWCQKNNNTEGSPVTSITFRTNALIFSFALPTLILAQGFEPGYIDPKPIVGEASDTNQSLCNHIQRLGLDVETIVPIYGEPTT